MRSNLILLFATHVFEGNLALDSVPESIRIDVAETVKQLEAQVDVQQ